MFAYKNGSPQPNIVSQMMKQKGEGWGEGERERERERGGSEWVNNNQKTPPADGDGINVFP